MKNLFAKILPFLAVIFGVVFIFFAVNEVKMQKSYTEAKGVITKIDEEQSFNAENESEIIYHVFVKYTVDGKEYEAELGEHTPFMKEGDTVKLKYNPKNPGKIVAAGPLGVILETAFGVFCLITGVILFIKRL